MARPGIPLAFPPLIRGDGSRVTTDSKTTLERENEMFRKILAAGVAAAGIGLVGGTATEANAHDRHFRGGYSGGWNHGHHHHYGGYRGGHVRIQPYPYYGGGFYGRPGGFYGRPYGYGRGGSGIFIGGRNFSFGYFNR